MCARGTWGGILRMECPGSKKAPYRLRSGDLFVFGGVVKR